MIYCIGEAVYDIIFKNDKPIEGKPGGAMLNTAVSVGRMGLPVSFIGDVADDRIGRITSDFLQQNQVDTSLVSFYPNARSRIALAFLDEHNNADYSFYKIKADKPEILFPKPRKEDVILFGSWFGIKPEIRAGLREFLNQARKAGSLIMYDPNFRPAHLHTLPQVASFIEENIGIAHITKGSDEDFQCILNTCDRARVHRFTKDAGSTCLIYTANKNGVWLFDQNTSKHYPAIPIQPVSTVGAGDSFNAGLLYALATGNIHSGTIHTLAEKQWDTIIDTAIRFATEVCMRYDNYISPGFAKQVKGE
jgi:fructokinase